MKQKAFTLMELMIVIVIIGILSTVGMVMFGGQSEKAKIALVKSNHKQISIYIATQMMECPLGGEIEAVTTSETYKYKNKSLSCANLGKNPAWTSKSLFDNISNYIQQTKNWTNPFDIEKCTGVCVNKSDAFEYFGGIPPSSWNGKMHCWWQGKSQFGQCASRFGTGSNDIVITKFPSVG